MLDYKIKILILDDTPTMRIIVSGMLEDLGFRSVVQAENTVQAKAVLFAEKPDLVLADWNMPGRTGIEFVRYLRSDEAFEHLPLVMMTANNDPEQIHEALIAGVSSYLVKPFSALDLKARIEEALRFHQTSRPTDGKLTL